MTLIKNLEVYGLDPTAVSAALQHRVQASTVLHPVPGSKDKVLVQIQGNQVQQVGKLLLGLQTMFSLTLDTIRKLPVTDFGCMYVCVYGVYIISNVFLLCFADQYQIPRKYVQGLDKPPTKPGKKK